jgi:hypothetical protein
MQYTQGGVVMTLAPAPRYCAQRLRTIKPLEYTDIHHCVYWEKVSKTPCRPRSWANFSPSIAVPPQECTGQRASFGPA